MEATNYTNIGPVLQLNKAGELTQKRMKAVKVCDGLYVTEPDKSGYTQFICELNGIVWLDCKAAENRIADGIKLMPGYFDKIKAGCFDGENIQEFKREISRRINHPDSPAIMELKQPERKKAAPLAENERKVSVLMSKGCTDEMTEKKVVITEVAPHIYTYAYKMKRYGERVKIILEVDGVYFEACDKGAYITEREDFTEVCTKAYEHARDNVAAGAASGMAYFIEVQKRIDAATPTETPRISTETAETVNVSAEGEKGAEMAENKPYYTHRWRVLHNCDLKTWDKFHKKHKEAILIFHHDTTYAALQKEAVKVSGMCGITYKVNRHGVEVCLFNDATLAQIIGQGICVAIAELPEVPDYGLIEPPQSPETPQTVEYAADTPKPRETARKRPNRAIGSAQHHQCSALGANGYAVLNDASATMAAMNVRCDTLRDTLRSVTHVPRECSTVDAAHW